MCVLQTVASKQKKKSNQLRSIYLITSYECRIPTGYAINWKNNLKSGPYFVINPLKTSMIDAYLLVMIITYLAETNLG